MRESHYLFIFFIKWGAADGTDQIGAVAEVQQDAKYKAGFLPTHYQLKKILAFMFFCIDGKTYYY